MTKFENPEIQVALLTGGGDRPYALGLASSLSESGVILDFIGSDFLDAPFLRQSPRVRFLNLRGDVSPHTGWVKKVSRVAVYYARLVHYVFISQPRIFHILWNNKCEFFDRTLLIVLYRLTRKRVALTVHNVNAAKRDGNDGALNRLTLWVQYRLVDHLFVHTAKMKRELSDDFGVSSRRVTVIPFGINNTVPNTNLSREDARVKLGLDPSFKVLLFFGNIAPYKGLEYLVEALSSVVGKTPECHLVIAGRPKGPAKYWPTIQERIRTLAIGRWITQHIEYIADDHTEVYFKAADIVVLPYTQVFQSGVLFLGYNFGLPAIATDVGSLAEDVLEGETGYICKPHDPVALADTINAYFCSDLYEHLESRRAVIRRFAQERYSWTTVGAITTQVYRQLNGQ
jgi:glycosyltransferase involved in cell wall biosynthesis